MLVRRDGTHGRCRTVINVSTVLSHSTFYSRALPTTTSMAEHSSYPLSGPVLACPGSDLASRPPRVRAAMRRYTSR